MMTSEEAIEILNRYDLNFHQDNGEPIPAEELADAIFLAVSALKRKDKDRWIRTAEKLPEVRQRVLVTYKDGSMGVLKCYDAGHLQWFYSRAVAWKPAPEPYQEELSG